MTDPQAIPVAAQPVTAPPAAPIGAGRTGAGPTVPPLVAAVRATPAATPAPRTGLGWTGWAGAATSLCLTAGMAVWAVHLTVRDVSEVPVIRALEGPARVAPENPGGAQAAYQGLALSDITSGGGAALAPDSVALAPEPLALAAPVRVAAAADAIPAPTALGDTVTGIVDTAASAAEPWTPAAGDKIAAPTPLAATLAAPAVAPAPDALEDALAVTREETPAAAPTELAVLRQSTRPRMRPAAARAAAAPIVASRPATGPQVAAAARDVAPETVAPGTRVAQLGAFDSADIAESEWSRLSARFPEYLDGKGRMIQKARSGGRDFWRLRVVGFEDGDAARRFCSALTAKNAPCIPVTMR